MRVALFLLICLLASMQTRAYERIDNIYEGLIPLADRSEAVRSQAIRDGLEQVLIRYTGYSAIASIPEIASELDSAQRYVIEYGVETIDTQADDQLGKIQRDALWVRFNAGMIDQLANQHELPIWPTLPPTIIYTLVIERWNEPYIPNMDEYPAPWLNLDAFFKARGLIAEPINETALKNLSAVDLWYLDQSTFDQLQAIRSERADIFLVVRVDGQHGRGYQLDFLFAQEHSETLIKRTGTELTHVLAAGVNAYIDQLSANLAFLGGNKVEKDLYVQIEGMRSFSEYRQLLNQIAGLEQVVSVRMENAVDAGIGYLIRYQSDQMLLIESIIEITGIKPLSPASNEQPLMAVPGSKENPIYFVYPNPSFSLRSESIFNDHPEG